MRAGKLTNVEADRATRITVRRLARTGTWPASTFRTAPGAWLVGARLALPVRGQSAVDAT